MVFQDVDFFEVNPAWGSLSFLNLWVYIFHQICDIFNHYFVVLPASISFVSFQDYNDTNDGFFVISLQISEVSFCLSLLLSPSLSLLLSFFYSIFSLLYRLSEIFKLIDSTLCHLHSTVDPCSNFFVFIIGSFSSVIYILFFFITSRSLLRFSVVFLFQEYL